MVQGNDADGDREQDDGDKGVGKEPEGLTAEVANGFVLRDVSSVDHGCPSKDYSRQMLVRVVSITPFVACAL
jgi:hypothetical protein